MAKAFRKLMLPPFRNNSSYSSTSEALTRLLPSIAHHCRRSTTRGHGNGMVRISLPGHRATARNVDVLILDDGAWSKGDGSVPEGVGGGIISCGEHNRTASGPVAEGCDIADYFYRLAKTCCDNLIKCNRY